VCLIFSLIAKHKYENLRSCPTRDENDDAWNDTGKKCTKTTPKKSWKKWGELAAEKKITLSVRRVDRCMCASMCMDGLWQRMHAQVAYGDEIIFSSPSFLNCLSEHVSVYGLCRNCCIATQGGT